MLICGVFMLLIITKGDEVEGVSFLHTAPVSERSYAGSRDHEITMVLHLVTYAHRMLR